MKNILAVCFLAFFTFVSTSCQRNSIYIEGQFENVPDGSVYLSILDSNLNTKPIDTTTIKNGHFIFDGSVTLDDTECLFISINKHYISIFMGNEKVNVKGDILKPESIEITGSEGNEQLKKFIENLPEQERLKNLQNELRRIGNDIDRANEIQKEMQETQEEQLAYIKKYINQNCDSPVGPFCLMNQIRFFSFEEVDEFVTKFNVNQASNKYVKALTRFVEENRARNEAQKRLAIGKEAPDFELTNNQGDTIKLSQFRGKIVLVDFWASWCQPCRRNNKTIVEVYNKFASKGLQIIGISVDKKESDWLNAKNEDMLPGIQLRDVDQVVAEAYLIEAIPACFLIDEEGKIIAKDVTGENLLNSIAQKIK